MKTYTLLFICLWLAACQPQYQQNTSQNALCQSLIGGYLKMQSLPGYQLWKITALPSITEWHYLYKKPTENGLIMTGLLQPKIEFVCSQQQQHLRLELLQTSRQLRLPLFELRLPVPASQVNGSK